MAVIVDVEVDEERIEAIDDFKKALEEGVMKFGHAEVTILDDNGETLPLDINIDKEVQEAVDSIIKGA